ncbi:hypothetical protein BCR43DRAFT_484208 [Syncephalastrum racemosum]|uniref:Probable 26S proteasome regulatory subunit p27 n=1 Tax=Syncephalastrum racemosum TaxID=13706 RepID=A0A1X2HWF5_SYNRA|nr:hypothetical protein BCR43DRAFT_484208 [Syncephalastrum racemosum]
MPAVDPSEDKIKKAQALVAKKDDIEEQLRALEDGLRIQGVGMDQPLVDREGFPRSDVDVAAARTSRHLVHRLRNDHKAIMREIEHALHEIHSAVKMQSEPNNNDSSTTSGNSDMMVDTNSGSDNSALQEPFAIVNRVAPDSPASASGLVREDRITRFGPVHAGNHERLQALNRLVASSEGQPIEVVVLRGSRSHTLSLTPMAGWGGRGTLGCHILPL